MDIDIIIGVKEKMTPFKSAKQARWMYANKPEIAKRWEKETPKGKKLPDKKEGHPGMIMDGVNTKTGKKVYAKSINNRYGR